MEALVEIKTQDRDASSDEVIPFVAFGKGLSDTVTFQGITRANLPVDDVSHGSLELSGVVHWIPSLWPRSIKPGLEVVSSFPLDRGSGAGRKDFALVSLIPQAQIGLNKRGHVMLNAAFEVPVNETERYDYRGYLYLIWDFADGGLFEGW